MQVMGDKLESKKLALSAKVNTIPGFSGVIRVSSHAIFYDILRLQDADHAVEIANQVPPHSSPLPLPDTPVHHSTPDHFVSPLPPPKPARPPMLDTHAHMHTPIP